MSNNKKMSVKEAILALVSDAKKIGVISREEIEKKLSSYKLSVEHIEKHFAEDISIETLAKVSNMSESRFYPCFKKALGVTPIDYINHFRINRAIIMLTDNRFTIEEISEKCGFQSSAYFRRVFKKITGKTPRDYKSTSFEI